MSASANNIKTAVQKSNAAFTNLVKAMGNAGVNISVVKNTHLPPAVNAIRNLKKLYAQAPANVAANVVGSNVPPKTPEAAVVNALAHLRARLPSPTNVLTAASYVAATNNLKRAENRKVGRLMGMYRKAELRQFWKNVNNLLKTPNTSGGPKINVLGPRTRAAINWVKAHPRLTALGAGLPALAVPAAAAGNIGAAGLRGAKAAGVSAMAPGSIAAEIRGEGKNLDEFLTSQKGRNLINRAVNSWARGAGVTGERLGQAQAMAAAYKGSNAAAKKKVTNAIQKAWPIGSRFKYNVTNTNKLINYVSKSYVPQNANKNVAAFKSRPFWVGATTDPERAVAYWSQKNLNQNKVFKNRTATGASLANFWTASNAEATATGLGAVGNANANKLRARKTSINAAWTRQQTTTVREREKALKSLFKNALNNTNRNAIIEILNKDHPLVPGVNKATTAALALRQSAQFTRTAPPPVSLKLNANINKVQGLKNFNKQILRAFIKEFSQTAPVTKTGGFLGIGRRTVGGQAALSAARKLRIPVKTATNILKKGNLGWGNAATNEAGKIVALLTKYPPAQYDWQSLIASLPSANAITNNVNAQALRGAINNAIAANGGRNRFGLPPP